MDRLLHTDMEAAELLNQSRATIWKLMKAGELASVKIGRSRRIPAAALRDFVERLTAAQVTG